MISMHVKRADIPLFEKLSSSCPSAFSSQPTRPEVFFCEEETRALSPLPVTPLTLCSAALGLLLVFRTTAAYERWRARLLIAIITILVGFC